MAALHLPIPPWVFDLDRVEVGFNPSIVDAAHIMCGLANASTANIHFVPFVH